MSSRMTTGSNHYLFDGIPVDPYDGTPGAPFVAATTYYIPIPFSAGLVTSIQISSDGTALATATVQHTDMPRNLDGTAIDPRVVGLGHMWVTDAAFGTLTIAASTGATGTDRRTFSNQPRRQSRLVLVIGGTGGRIVGAANGLA